ncbi:type II toxin-antitoxin system VapC family toxin [Alkalicoccus urumqiensis]|uniref:Uncharacterized protein n=1 Tax=Alkalicoccus urumqiensis TaxID=1548213 RepID=A0A2P6MJJ1_ALKUR|nr:type II toxin-antitoxin system VapC family toxin [Alkalicoccus urumqiensis]PRO66452.1 hypothetical protein C6I21_03685 [Alkalicoccus urumqiensis]
MKTDNAAFIDANVLIEAAAYSQENVLEWLSNLYEAVYIHQQVLEELQLSSVRKRVKTYISQGKWKLFDPEDEAVLSDADYAVYDSYVKDIREAFRRLDRKKEAEGRRIKHTNDLGEMHCIAAALLLNVGIICSNDYDIGEVVVDEHLTIHVPNEEEMPLQHDTLVDVCYAVICREIGSKSSVRKFLKTVRSSRISDLDARL